MGDADEAPQKELVTNLTLDILQIVKVSQSQHGLRHGDHARYRQYCTRRLARLYKANRMSHGRGRYQKRTLEVSIVDNEAFLLIPLMMSERAWSYAMELKRDAGNEPRKRAHMIRRLKKATVHATELVNLCDQVGSARTALEAEAYSSYIFGCYLSEQERDWDRALAKFMRARKAFEQLARVGGPDQAEVCRERLEELEPSLRYCTYKRGNEGSPVAGSMDEKDMAALKGDGGEGDERLKAVLAEESGRASGAVTTGWRGYDIPIRNGKVRECLANVAVQLAKIESPLIMATDRALAIFDKVFMLYSDARQHIRDDLAEASSGAQSDSTSRLTDLKLADRAIAVMSIEQTIQRNKFLVDSANAKLAGEIRLAKGEKATRPEDIVHLLSATLQSYEELIESGPEVLRGMDGAERIEEELRVECMTAQKMLSSDRAAALGKVHSSAGSHVDAAILFNRSAEHAAGVSEVAATRARVNRIGAIKSGIDTLLADRKGLRSGLEDVSLEGPTSSESCFLMESLDEYKPAVLGKGASKVHIMPIPNRMESLAVRPIVLDVAGDEIVYPTLTHRSAKKGSTLRNLFSWKK